MTFREDLIDILKSEGWSPEGEPTIESAKAFITDQNIALTHKGSPLNIDEIWAKRKPAKVLNIDSDDADGDDAGGTVNVSLRDIRSLKSAARDGLHAKVNRVDGAPAVHTGERMSAKSLYAARVKNMGFGTAHNQPAYADPDAAELATAIIRRNLMGERYKRWRDDEKIISRSQIVTINDRGGYTVPDELSNQILYMTEPYGVARRIARVTRMGASQTRIPVRSAIPTAVWDAEASTASVTRNAYDHRTLVPNKLFIMMQSSSELLEDSAINVADDIASSIREQYDIAIDNAYFLGDGTSTYGGYTGLANALPAGAYQTITGTSWSALTSAHIMQVFATLENINTNNVAVVCSRQFYQNVFVRLDIKDLQFKNLLSTGKPGADAWLGAYPIYFSQVLPRATGNGVKSCYFGDFRSASVIGERRDLEIMSSEHFAFNQDLFTWRATARTGVLVHGDGRVPASTIGPIACLVAGA